VKIGGPEVIVMAGTCSVETEGTSFQDRKTIVKDSGAKIFTPAARLNAHTSPYSFQGLGEEGLKLLRSAADEYKLKVITEVMDKSQIDLVEKYADILQIGRAKQCKITCFLKDSAKHRSGYAQCAVLLQLLKNG